MASGIKSFAKEVQANMEKFLVKNAQSVQEKAIALLSQRLGEQDKEAELILNALQGKGDRSQHFFHSSIYNTLNMEKDVADYVISELKKKGFDVVEKSPELQDGTIVFEEETISPDKDEALALNDYIVRDPGF